MHGQAGLSDDSIAARTGGWSRALEYPYMKLVAVVTTNGMAG
jgi:hypothetical protein